MKIFSRHNPPDLTGDLATPYTSALFKEILRSGLTLRVKVTGRSMAPFLNGGEVLTIKQIPVPSLQVGDLIFFTAADNSLLLHRVVRMQRREKVNIVQTKGDALRGLDDPVCAENILGKVISVERCGAGGRKTSLDMESFPRRISNYLIAKKSLVKSNFFVMIQRCSISPSLRSFVKKTFL
ncbi:MAG: signal peptidase I [Nitrospirota bacterium]